MEIKTKEDIIQFLKDTYKEPYEVNVGFRKTPRRYLGSTGEFTFPCKNTENMPKLYGCRCRVKTDMFYNVVVDAINVTIPIAFRYDIDNNKLYRMMWGLKNEKPDINAKWHEFTGEADKYFNWWVETPIHVFTSMEECKAYSDNYIKTHPEEVNKILEAEKTNVFWEMKRTEAKLEIYKKQLAQYEQMMAGNK